MTDIEVRDKYNMIIGWCRDQGDQITATHIRKGYVGCYIKRSNITLDRSGKVFCYGDGTQSLIRSEE